MKSLSINTIPRETINGTILELSDIGQTEIFGYHVKFIEFNRIVGEAVIMKGEELFETIQYCDFHMIAELIYNRLK